MREKRYSEDMKGHMNTIQKATEEQIINGLAIKLRQMEPYMLKLTGNAYQEINQLKKLCKKYGATLEVIAKSRGYDLLTGKHDIEMMRPEGLTDEWTPIAVRVGDPVCQMLERAGLNE